MSAAGGRGRGPDAVTVPPCEGAALGPFGRALRAFADGEDTAVLLVRRDDGLEAPLPVRHFFRGESELTPIERAAVDAASGRVLDIGAGAGIHSLLLEARGHQVTALDSHPVAVEIMSERGVTDTRRQEFLRFRDRPFDTLLLLGHGVGMAGGLPGLAPLLEHARSLLRPAGVLFLDSVDVTASDDPVHQAYHTANHRAGRYVGETRIQFEFRGERGPYCGWLHVDPGTLADQAAAAGLRCAVELEMEGGEFLARLTR